MTEKTVKRSPTTGDILPFNLSNFTTGEKYATINDLLEYANLYTYNYFRGTNYFLNLTFDKINNFTTEQFDKIKYLQDLNDNIKSLLDNKRNLNNYIFDDNIYVKDENNNIVLVSSINYVNEKITEKITELIDNSPDNLNTLNELSKALNDDSNFASTVNNLISKNKNDILTISNDVINVKNDILINTDKINNNTYNISLNSSSINDLINNLSNNYYTSSIIDNSLSLINDNVNALSSNLYNNYYNKTFIDNSINNIIFSVGNLNSYVDNNFYNKINIDDYINNINISINNLNSYIDTNFYNKVNIFDFLAGLENNNVFSGINTFQNKTNLLNDVNIDANIFLRDYDINEDVIINSSNLSKLKNINTNIQEYINNNDNNITNLKFQVGDVLKTLTIGEVKTLDYNKSATAEIIDDILNPHNLILNLGIPKGKNGSDASGDDGGSSFFGSVATGLIGGLAGGAAAVSVSSFFSALNNKFPTFDDINNIKDEWDIEKLQLKTKYQSSNATNSTNPILDGNITTKETTFNSQLKINDDVNDVINLNPYGLSVIPNLKSYSVNATDINCINNNLNIVNNSNSINNINIGTSMKSSININSFDVNINGFLTINGLPYIPYTSNFNISDGFINQFI